MGLTNTRAGTQARTTVNILVERDISMANVIALVRTVKRPRVLRCVAWIFSFLALFASGAFETHASSAQYFYDPSGRLTGMLDSVNGSTQYNYDNSGNITSIVNSPISTLTILQVSPTSAPAGAVITISGTGFGTTANTSVGFNGTTATPSAVTSTSITVAVPMGAASGTLSVTAPSGTANWSSPFTVLPSAAPTITSFSTGTSTPTIATAGSSLTITGTNFDPINSQVTINGQPAQVANASSTSLVVIVPSAASGKVSVQTSVGSATSTADLIMAPASFAPTAVGAFPRTSIGQPNLTVPQSGSPTVSLALFDATAGQGINVRFDSTGSPGCLSLSVLSPNGATVFPADSICGNVVWSGGIVVAQAGTYSLEVVPSAGAGSFVTQILNVPPDATATLSTAGTTGGINITTPGQHGRFDFAGTAGQQVNILLDFTYVTTCDTFSIVDPAGVPIVGPTHVCGRNYVNGGSFTLPQTGAYAITIVPDLGSGLTDGTGQVSATIFTIPPDVTGILVAGQPSIPLVVSTPGQHADFTFSGATGEIVTLLLDWTQMTNCGSIVLLNPDGTTLVGPENWCGISYVSSPLTLPQTGTYTLTNLPGLPNSLTGGTGKITATLNTVPPNVNGTVTIGGPTSALFVSTPGQQATFTFNGASGQIVALLLDNSQMTNCGSFSLLNPDGSVLVGPENWCGIGYVNIPLTLPQTGTYTIAFMPGLPGSLIAGIGKLAATIFIVPDDVEGTATIGGPTSALFVSTPGQHADFTFNGTAGQVIAPFLDNSQMVNCGSFSLLNPDGSTLVGPENWCGLGWINTPLTLPQTGIYKIAFVPGTPGALIGGTGPLYLTLLSVPADVMGVSTIGGPTSELIISTPGQHGDFTFAGTTGQVVTFLLDNSQMSNCGSISITNPDSSVLAGPDNWCGIGFVNSAPFTLPQTGTYTITIVPGLGGVLSAAQGPFFATLFAVPGDATGTATIGGPTSTIAIPTPGQHADFSFSGTSGQSVNVFLDATQMSNCVTASVLKPDGSTLVGSTHLCGTGSLNAPLTLPQTGSYTITIVPDLGGSWFGGTGPIAVIISQNS
jgi:YD repeat-containing protein